MLKTRIFMVRWLMVRVSGIRITPPSCRSGSWKSLSLSRMRGTPGGRNLSGSLHGTSAQQRLSMCLRQRGKPSDRVPTGALFLCMLDSMPAGV